MSVTFGFYNALNHDRKYDAIQVSSIFDGIINDGIYESIGTAMIVKATSYMVINIGIGRAWFNHTWTYNDSILPLTVQPSELVLNRIDTVILEVDSTRTVRTNNIKIIEGTPAATPVAITLVNNENVHQYPLARIYVKANATVITQADITNTVGTSECPFVTGIISTLSTDNLIQQWESSYEQWLSEQTTSFNTWFAGLKNELDSNQAANLLNQINLVSAKANAIEKEKIDGYYNGTFLATHWEGATKETVNGTVQKVTASTALTLTVTNTYTSPLVYCENTDVTIISSSISSKTLTVNYTSLSAGTYIFHVSESASPKETVNGTVKKVTASTALTLTVTNTYTSPLVYCENTDVTILSSSISSKTLTVIYTSLSAGTYVFHVSENASPFTQEATVTDVTANTLLGPPMTKTTKSQATNETLQEVLGIINSGVTDSEDGKVLVTTFEKPTGDIDVYWFGKNVT